jgi:sugar phosphate isomerase/epimerase
MVVSVASRRVLCNGSLPRTPFRELVAAAAGAGFDAITVWPHAWYRAQRREGLAPGEMREILDAYGVAVTDVETAADWLPYARGADAPATPVKANHTRESLFEIGEALGAGTLIAAHLTGGAVDRGRAIEGFGALCDDAARHGLRVALEAVPFTGIATVADAWAVVDGAGRSTGGIVFDVVHHARGGMEDQALLTVPAERYFAIQLGDAERAAPPDLLEEAMYHRLPPGDGELPITALLRLLERHGVHAPAGPEVYRREWDERQPLEVARVLGRATDAVLTR